MATSAMAGVSFLQLGPRQGVYCRPSVVLTAVPGGGYQQQYVAAGGGRLKWRMSQFKSPEHNYRLRARPDVEENPPENIPQIAGRIIERPLSAVSQGRGTLRSPPKMSKSHSSCNLHHSTPSGPPLGPRIPQQQQQTTVEKLVRTSSGTILQERHRKSNTAPVFSIQASSVTMQSRPLARSLTAPPKKIVPPEEPFPYPDPISVVGDHTFNIRLTEMAGLQRETVKLEEFRVRIARRNVGTNTTSGTAASLHSNNPHQPAVSGGVYTAAVRPSSSGGTNRVCNRTGFSRRTSLPAAGHPATPPLDKPPPPTSLSSSLLGVSQTTGSRVSPPLSSISEHRSLSNSDSSTTSPCSLPEDPNNTSSKKLDTTAQITDTLSREKDTADEIKITEGVGSNVNEGGGEMDAVERKKVVPSSHHRDLVGAIFSRQQSPSEAESCTELSGVIGANNDRVSANLKSEQSTTGVSSQAKAVGYTIRPSSARPSSSSKSKTTSSSPKPLPQETSTTPSTPVASPTNRASSPSSASSSSTTSEHSPRPASGHSGKKTKSSKTRKTSHKKSHGRHKNT